MTPYYSTPDSTLSQHRDGRAGIQTLMSVRCNWCGLEGAHVIGVPEEWWRLTGIFEEVEEPWGRVLGYRCLDRESCAARRIPRHD